MKAACLLVCAIAAAGDLIDKVGHRYPRTSRPNRQGIAHNGADKVRCQGKMKIPVARK